MRHTLTGLLLLGTLTLGGCIFAPDGGNGLKWERDNTLGQELIDLDRAHQSGVISDDEYARLKARLLRDR
ncbi:MAG: SHOCT domain-containing protein [Pseudomonadales bacterium]|jgi:hypothetical protein|nr:SHOCT domain-containing protein [Pseudomonadales bacterium]